MKLLMVSLFFFVFSTGAMATEELILEGNPFKKVHGSSLVELANGEMMACFFAGTDEGHPDVQIYCSTKTESGWSAPRVAVKKVSLLGTRGNSSLHVDGNGRVWMYFVSTVGGWAVSTVFGQYSDDNGHTWSDCKVVRGQLGSLIRTKPVPFDEQRIILPYYIEPTPVAAGSRVCVLTPGERARPKYCVNLKGSTAIQPSVVYDAKNNVIHTYMRNTKNTGVLYSRIDVNTEKISKSKYTPIERLHLDNPNSSIDVEIVGDWVYMVLNDIPAERYEMSLARAPLQNPTQFETLAILDREKDMRFEYPNILHGSDGQLHISYSHEGNNIKYIRREP